MKAILLDGSHENDAAGGPIRAALTAQLQAGGYEVEYVLLRQKKIGNCAGDFFCWVRSPGVCNVDDDNRAIAAAIANSDLLVYLTRVTFGGYASTLKRMVDHQIQNISPFFAKVEGETHHAKRYAHYPNFLAIGWMDEPNPRAEAIFRRLVYRNSLNFYARRTFSGIVTGSQPEAQLDTLAASWLQSLARGTDSPQPAPQMPLAASTPAPRRAVLLVGSPRTRRSTSASLGGYLFEQLSARGLETETIHIYTALNNPARMHSLLQTLDAADLAVLAFPLYVDSLPAPVITLLERIAARRAEHPAQTRFAALANCGFPEAHHNDNALAICAEFASQTGMDWMGSLALGAGEGIVHGAPLNELDGRAIPLKNALNLAAESLARGRPIPPAAQKFLARPLIPAWLYRFVGTFGWRQQAKRWGMEGRLNHRAYARS